MALNLITPVSDVHRRDFAVDDSDLLDPTSATHLKQGEWVGMTANGQVRAATAMITGDNIAEGEGPFYQVFSQKGDYGAQALGKVTCIMSFGYEAETDMYEDGTYSVGQLLTITNGDTDGGETGDDTRFILGPQENDADVIVGVVTMLPSATASGLLRFQRLSPYHQA